MGRKWVVGEERLRMPYDFFLEWVNSRKIKESSRKRYIREWHNYRKNFPDLSHYVHTYHFTCKSKYVGTYSIYGTVVEHLCAYKSDMISPDDEIAVLHHNGLYPDHDIIDYHYHNTLPVSSS